MYSFKVSLDSVAPREVLIPTTPQPPPAAFSGTNNHDVPKNIDTYTLDYTAVRTNDVRTTDLQP